MTIDTGLATCGYTVFDGQSLVDADVFTSSPSKRPAEFSGAWEALDTARRGRGLGVWLLEARKRWRSKERPLQLGAEAVVAARQARALAMQQCATGVVILFGLVTGQLTWHTPLEWRARLGWFPSDTRGMTKREKNKAKKRDDERLYSMLRTLHHADRLERLVLAHGRKRGDLVHAWDAFGLGRALLQESRS